MTRGIYLDAIDEGKKVRVLYCGNWYTFFLDEHKSWRHEPDIFVSAKEVFLDGADYEILPEPDTAEKFVRDLAKYFQCSHWLLSGTDPETDLKWSGRLTALLAQMDGEK